MNEDRLYILEEGTEIKDIFLSYKSEDRPRAKIIAEALEQHGYSVWWDQEIGFGERWRQVIKEELRTSKCVVVLWSQNSVESNFVVEEAAIGQKRKILIPILIDDMDVEEIPFGFVEFHAAKLIDWQGALPNPAFDRLLKSINKIIYPPQGKGDKTSKGSLQPKGNQVIVHKGDSDLKIYCASDLHIGYEQANYLKIEEFFNIVKNNANELILCGDIFDLWRCDFESIIKERRSTYEALRSTARKVPTTIIYGDHDYELWEKLRIPIKVTGDFLSNNIFFCHGCQFDPRLRKVSFNLLKNKLPSFYRKYSKSRVGIIIEKIISQSYDSSYIAKIHDRAKSFAKKQSFDYIVMGHTHNPLKDGKLFDCGDMIDSLTYVVIDNGKPRLETMSRN